MFSTNQKLMSRYHSYINNAHTIIETYDGKIPLAIWLKSFFSARKQIGSRDRKEIANMVYAYFRLGNALHSAIPIDERILIGLLLCSNQPTLLLSCLQPEYISMVNNPLDEKIDFIQQLDVKKLFPMSDCLSEGIDETIFLKSHLVQPNLFIRIRNGYKKIVLEKLAQHSIDFTIEKENCLSFPSSSKISEWLKVDQEIVIQDYASQAVGDFFAYLSRQQHHITKVWDCCAASGGKSILAWDLLPNIQLTVTDIRLSIIENLKKRFQIAGIERFDAFVTDSTRPIHNLIGKKFDLIICDAPCTGSGTWGRTPENLVFFKQETVAQMADLQKKIVSNTIPYLAKGGYFLYITCSVYRQENEEIVDFILQQFTQLKLVEKRVMVGYMHKGDTMFGSLFCLSGSK